MKIRLLIVTQDREYAELFCKGAAAAGEVFEMGVCIRYEKANDMLTKGKYDAALIEWDAMSYVSPHLVKNPFILWNQRQDPMISGYSIPILRKYQRISAILSEIQGFCAPVSSRQPVAAVRQRPKVISVWSPAGGSGVTTIALAKAVREASRGQKVVYVDLEYYSGSSVLMDAVGESMSLLWKQQTEQYPETVEQIMKMDPETKVGYFCPPQNPDEMNQMQAEDVEKLLTAVTQWNDYVIVDLPSVCNQKARVVFDKSDKILLVVNHSKIAEAKVRQFIENSQVFRMYSDKVIIVRNEGSELSVPEGMPVISVKKAVSENPVEVVKAVACEEVEC